MIVEGGVDGSHMWCSVIQIGIVIVGHQPLQIGTTGSTAIIVAVTRVPALNATTALKVKPAGHIE
jgi:hypothetical protein